MEKVARGVFSSNLSFHVVVTWMVNAFSQRSYLTSSRDPFPFQSSHDRHEQSKVASKTKRSDLSVTFPSLGMLNDTPLVSDECIVIVVSKSEAQLQTGVWRLRTGLSPKCGPHADQHRLVHVQAQTALHPR